MTQISKRLPIFLLALLLVMPRPAVAEGGKTILVLDGSGSMWGQIAGEAKITIAQSVIGQLLHTLPPDEALGLYAYGHRRKGSCSDIELMVPPAAGNVEAVRQAVNGIKPKGKTPMSASVIAAAEALKYQEDRATIILVSDGRETCNLDPCGVAIALEDAGADFTAHVVGFDVADPEDIRQLSCLADNTGGKFLTASTADELALALEEVAVEAAPRFDVGVQAVNLATGGPVAGSVDYRIRRLDTGEVVLETSAPAQAVLSLKDGRYEIEANQPGRFASGSATFEVAGGAPGPVRIELAGPSLSAKDKANVGETVEVAWTGPNHNDVITLATPGADEDRYLAKAETRTGSPVSIKMPRQPGRLELRYFHGPSRTVVARRPIEVVTEATLEAPATAAPDSIVEVFWTGPDVNDRIRVAEPGSKDDRYLKYANTRQGSPAKLEMPRDPGVYEIRYYYGPTRQILARREIEVVVAATLEAPETASPEEEVTVSWTGPDVDDRIRLSEKRSREDQYVAYSNTRSGSPLTIKMPKKPGQYELRYIYGPTRQIIATRDIEVVVSATLQAPDTAEPGQTISVAWTGPDIDDRIRISEKRARDDTYVGYANTRDGSPLDLKMPSKIGTYELRYYFGPTREILARRDIEIVATAKLSAPETAAPGETITVSWSGPDINDRIRLAEKRSRDDTYMALANTRKGSPLELRMPSKPGDYELRYYYGPSKTILARRDIKVVADASISAPGTAAPGATITVSWVGPDIDDRIYIAEKNARDNTYKSFARTRDGSPLQIKVPNEPGDYEVRYFFNPGKTVLARSALKVMRPLPDDMLEAERVPAGEIASLIGNRWTASPDEQGGRPVARTWYGQDGTGLRLAQSSPHYSDRKWRVDDDSAQVCVEDNRRSACFELWREGTRIYWRDPDSGEVTQAILGEAATRLTAGEIGEMLPGRHFTARGDEADNPNAWEITFKPDGTAYRVRDNQGREERASVNWRIDELSGLACTDSCYALFQGDGDAVFWAHVSDGRLMATRVAATAAGGREGGTAAAAADDLAKLTAADITAALSGVTVVGTDPAAGWQMIFVADGTFVRLADGEPPSSGQWSVNVVTDQYCDGGACYDVMRSGDTLVWVDPVSGERMKGRLLQ